MTNPESNPTEIFLNLIVSFLTSMFLTAAGGNVEHARIAAAASVNAYTARNPADLLPIAQLIAFTLVILDSLDRSMDDNLPIALVLRLRGNAVSLGRLAEQCRRALPAAVTSDRTGPTIDSETERRHEAQARADLARAEQRLAQVQASFTAPTPPPPPATTPPPAAATAAAKPLTQPPSQEDRHRTAWAAAMTDVAREFTDDLDFLPPTERRATTTRATVLSSVAHQLLSGEPLPPATFTLSPQHKPLGRPPTQT
jgi:hypothetical protein